jgi:CDP-diacylglycerol--glycerol-3-phosphate 3-phosphatidyltransferase
VTPAASTPSASPLSAAAPSTGQDVPRASDTPSTSAPLPAWKRTLPNALTAARVVIAIAFVILLQSWKPLNVPITHPDWVLIYSTIFFSIAAITDIFDGRLARAWGVESKFGRVMDPFADKVLVLGAFILLAGPDFSSLNTIDPDGKRFHISGIEPWMVVVVLIRELLVTSLRGLIESHGGSFAASLAGKLKMIVQSVGLPIIMIILALFPVQLGTPGRFAILIVTWIMIIVTVISGLPYLIRGIQALRDSEPSPTPPQHVPPPPPPTS